MTTETTETGDIRTSKMPEECGDEPCFICGRETKGSKSRGWVHTFEGALVYVTEPTEEEMDSASYSGLHPVGSKCARACRKAGVVVLTNKQVVEGGE